jgi:hypothetical protein
MVDVDLYTCLSCSCTLCAAESSVGRCWVGCADWTANERRRVVKAERRAGAADTEISKENTRGQRVIRRKHRGRRPEPLKPRRQQLVERFKSGTCLSCPCPCRVLDPCMVFAVSPQAKKHRRPLVRLAGSLPNIYDVRGRFQASAGMWP